MTSELMALAARVAKIESRTAITDLILLHAEYIRAGTLGQALGLFTPDATFELRYFDPDFPGETVLQQRMVGVHAILESKEDMAGQSAQLWPMIHNIRIELDGDKASSTCVSMTSIWPHGKDFVGEYRDTFRRDDGIWRFASRAFILFGGSDGSYAIQSHEKYVAVKH